VLDRRVPVECLRHHVGESALEARLLGGVVQVLAVVDERAGDLRALDLQIELARLEQTILSLARLVDLLTADLVLERLEPIALGVDQRREAIALHAVVEATQALERRDDAVRLLERHARGLHRLQERVAADLALDELEPRLMRALAHAPRSR